MTFCWFCCSYWFVQISRLICITNELLLLHSFTISSLKFKSRLWLWMIFLKVQLASHLPVDAEKNRCYRGLFWISCQYILIQVLMQTMLLPDRFSCFEITHIGAAFAPFSCSSYLGIFALSLVLLSKELMEQNLYLCTAPKLLFFCLRFSKMLPCSNARDLYLFIHPWQWQGIVLSMQNCPFNKGTL